ncbi:MAG: extracellular solute-binding protein [Caldilineaceae bacterium]|nr:extracellular solute-binding protein [Caldilineaceae bacterium]
MTMSNNLSRRQFLQLTGAAAALGTLAACAAPAAAPQPATGGEAAASDKVLLKWDTFRGPGTGWNEERIETFQEQFPNVEIEFRPLTGSSQQDNYGKMYAQFAAGDLGDICAFDPSHFHFWRAINGNIIGPLDDLVAADNTDLSQWFEQFMVLQHYQGNLYGFPSWGWAGFDTFVINAVHFEEEGIELPDPIAHDTPMETYAEWAHRLYKENERFGLNMSWGEAGLVTLCRAFNGDLINAEGTQCLLLEDENAQAGLRWAYKIAVEDKILPAPGTIDNIDTAQMEGRVTMNWSGSLNVRNVKRGIQDESVARVHQGLLPTDNNGRYPSQIRGGTWNILKESKHPQEAFQFLKHITNTDGCYSFNLVAGQGAFVRPDVVNLLIEQDPVHEWFIPNLENGIPAHAPANSRGREYTDACAQWMTLMMDANQPIPFEKGLEDLHNNIQMVLDMPAAA